MRRKSRFWVKMYRTVHIPWQECHCLHSMSPPVVANW